MSSENIGFVHFDKPTNKNNRIEALVVKEKVSSLHLNKFVKIINIIGDNKNFIGRIAEGPFFSLRK